MADLHKLPTSSWVAMAALMRSVESQGWPEQLRCTVTVFLHKTEAAGPTTADKYRPITLLPQLYRLYARYRLREYRLLILQHLPREFKAGRPAEWIEHTTLDLHLTIQEHVIMGRTVSGLCADLAKAFDHVDHELLKAALTRLHWPDFLVRAILSMYSAFRYIRIAEHAVQLGPLTSSIPQGCPLAIYAMQATMVAIMAELTICPHLSQRGFVDDHACWAAGKPRESARTIVAACEALRRATQAQSFELQLLKTKAWSTN
eukprot:1524751-Amphidinium_carterae.1